MLDLKFKLTRDPPVTIDILFTRSVSLFHDPISKLLLSSCSTVINTSRYGILDIQGVKLAIQTAASAKGQRPTQADKEKKDRAVAKTILDKLGMESEKYRLGYTKVTNKGTYPFILTTLNS